MAAPRIQQRVPAYAEQVPRLRAAVNAFAADYCEHDDETRVAVSVAVTEACTNVVCHAYPETGGDVMLAAWIDNHHLLVDVIDHGVGLNGAATTKGLGLGLPLMHELAETTIDSDHYGTRVHLRFPRT